MVDHYAISSVLTAAAVFLLGFFVFFNRPHDRTAGSFYLLSFAISFWSFGLFMHAVSGDAFTVIFWGRFLHLGAIFIPIFLYDFTVRLVNRTEQRKGIIQILYVLGIIFLFMLPTEYFISGVSPKHGYLFWVEPGPLYILHVVMTISLVVASMIEIFSELLRSKGFKKNQLEYYLAAVLIGYGFGGLNYLLNYNIPVIYISPYINYAILFYVALTAYAITRYRLMDINVIIRKGTVYSAVTLVFSVLYMSIIYGSEYLIKPVVSFNIMWITLPAIFVLALFFQPISEKVQEIIERNVFRKQYLADKIAKKFSDGIKELMNIDDLSTFITRAAVKVFKLKGSAIFVINEKDKKYMCLDARAAFAKYKGAFYSEEDIVIAEMKRTKKAIVREEVRLSMEQAIGSEKGHFKRIMERLEELETFICVPSISSKRGGEVVGFLIGGEKESGDMFSSEDISLLETFSRQASVSIENALMYQAQIDEIEQSMEKSRMSELGSTAAGVAHEAKNALNYINLFSQALHLKKDDKEFLRGATQNFESETERMRILMEGVVDYSNPTAIEIKDENLKKLIDECVVLVRDQAKGKNIAIEVNVDENAVIKVDRNSIKQVFLNLFLNALDAMPKDGKLAVKTDAKDGKLIVSVADTGSGIPESKLSKIFEPFFTTKEQGTGLGLAIVKKAVEANRGRMSVESKVGVGTVFRVAFSL